MSVLVFLGLLAGTIAWCVLPLLPSLRELLWPTDIEPLHVVGRDAGDVGYFARRFKTYLEGQLRTLPPAAASGDWYGRLPDGTAFLRVCALPEVLHRGPRADGAQDRVVVIEPPIQLPGGETFVAELTARQRFAGGPGATYRALYGEHDVRVGPDSTILRWVHAEGTLEVEGGTTLYGRATSARSIVLATDVTFHRLAAPTLQVAGAGGAPPTPARTPSVFQPPADAVPIGDHLRVPLDCVLPEGAEHDGNLVVAGALHLHAGASVRGSVKAHRGVTLEHSAIVDGSIVSRTTCVIGPFAIVRGPVIAESEIQISQGVTVGRPDAPTTVVAPRVRLAPGVVIHGQVTATLEGQSC